MGTDNKAKKPLYVLTPLLGEMSPESISYLS